jgi:hypothetical protein
VKKVVPGGPADRAGLRRGDALLAIDGVALHGRALPGRVAAPRPAPTADLSTRCCRCRNGWRPGRAGAGSGGLSRDTDHRTGRAQPCSCGHPTRSDRPRPADAGKSRCGPCSRHITTAHALHGGGQRQPCGAGLASSGRCFHRGCRALSPLLPRVPPRGRSLRSSRQLLCGQNVNTSLVSCAGRFRRR